MVTRVLREYAYVRVFVWVCGLVTAEEMEMRERERGGGGGSDKSNDNNNKQQNR